MSELKLVEGKQYEYRNGIRCKLIHWDEENKTWISIRLDDNSLADELHYHSTSGSAIGFSGFDIVSEYIEPPKPMKIWVNWYNCPEGTRNFGCVYPSKTRAVKAAIGRQFIKTIHFQEVAE